MIITGTGSIVGVLTIEYSDPQSKSFTALVVRAGQSYTVSDSLRFTAPVINALESGLITVTHQSTDEASGSARSPA